MGHNKNPEIFCEQSKIQITNKNIFNILYYHYKIENNQNIIKIYFATSILSAAAASKIQWTNIRNYNNIK